MGHLGFEPRTDRLKAGYSTAELMPPVLNFQVAFCFRKSGEEVRAKPSLNHPFSIAFLRGRNKDGNRRIKG